MNHGASAGRMPEKVFVNDLARVTAGFAKDVEAVNKYAPVMYNPTAYGTASERAREQPQIIDSNPKVATTSLKTCAPPALTWVDALKMGSPNMRCAEATPAN